KSCCLVALACAVLFLGSPAVRGEEAKDLLIGKWEGKEKAGDKELVFVLEFTKDNKMKVSIPDFGINLDGSYKVTGPDTIEVTIKGPDGKEKTDQSKFKVS